MSVDLYVLFNDPLPSVQVWEARAAHDNFPLRFDRRFDPAKDSGAWPMKVGNADAAPQVSFGDDGATMHYGPPLTLGPWQHQFVFSTGARPSEAVAATFAAVSLAEVTTGVVFDPQGGLSYRGPSLQTLVRQLQLICPGWACIGSPASLSAYPGYALTFSGNRESVRKLQQFGERHSIAFTEVGRDGDIETVRLPPDRSLTDLAVLAVMAEAQSGRLGSLRFNIVDDPRPEPSKE